MTRRLTLLGLLSVAVLLGACAKRGAEPAENTSTAKDYPQQQVTLVTPIPFADSVEARDAVREECDLQAKLERFIKQYGAERNIDITSSSSPGSGKVLAVRITEIYAPGGGAFSGGKSVTIAGELTEGGSTLGTFRARRISGGGAFAAFKGTCDILGRDVKTLGSDVSEFLTDPKPDARMGNI